MWFSNVESTSLGKDVALSILQKHLALAKPVEGPVVPPSLKVKLEQQMAAQEQQYQQSVKVEQSTVKQQMLQHMKLTVQQSTLLAEVKLPKVPHGTVGQVNEVNEVNEGQDWRPAGVESEWMKSMGDNEVKCAGCGERVQRLDWHGQHSSKDFRNY